MDHLGFQTVRKQAVMPKSIYIYEIQYKSSEVNLLCTKLVIGYFCSC